MRRLRQTATFTQEIVDTVETEVFDDASELDIDNAFAEDADWTFRAYTANTNVTSTQVVFHGDIEELEDDGGPERQIMLLRDLRPGAIFVIADGTRAVKTEYKYHNGTQSMCVLLESGEFAHFSKGDLTLVSEIGIS